MGRKTRSTNDLLKYVVSPARVSIDAKLLQEAPLKILLVDDNKTNLLVGRRILEMLGYKDIPSADNGLDGFEAAEKDQYDLVLMDLQMPVMDGFTALERIKTSPITGGPCVVALTANADMVSPKTPFFP